MLWRIWWSKYVMAGEKKQFDSLPIFRSPSDLLKKSRWLMLPHSARHLRDWKVLLRRTNAVSAILHSWNQLVALLLSSSRWLGLWGWIGPKLRILIVQFLTRNVQLLSSRRVLALLNPFTLTWVNTPIAPSKFGLASRNCNSFCNSCLSCKDRPATPRDFNHGCNLWGTIKTYFTTFLASLASTSSSGW